MSASATSLPYLSNTMLAIASDQVEIVWQMGLASLLSNNGELVLTLAMAASLAPNGIEELKIRLSRHLGGASTLGFIDHDRKIFRICRVPDLLQAGDSPASYGSPPITTPSPKLSTSDELSARPFGKKSKVPRPPNAFILYRQKYHPLLKAERPDMHNNEISVILGKQWKDEPETVRAEWRAKAVEVKLKHAAAHPDYQYAPRKPSEKKRRNTARKMARARAQADEDNQHPSHLDILDIADYERFESEGATMMESPSSDSVDEQPQPDHASVEDYIRNKRSASFSHFQETDQADLIVPMPMNVTNFQDQTDSYNEDFTADVADPFDADSRELVETSLAQHVQNDQDFFNSLIDWEGVQADMDLIHTSINDEQSVIPSTETGNSFLSLDEQRERLDFEAEIQRTLALFQS